jgi:osmotically-inducible protein OsmY
MKTDSQLLVDVQAELEWDPSFDNRGIVVAVKDGVVTLAGYVSSYADKWAAEKATKSVAGVRALANDIEVKLGTAAERPDKDIAEAAANALKSNVSVPASDIKAIVNSGWVTLEGKVTAWYQKNAAENAVRSLWGVKGISNNIELKPQVKAADVKSKIQQVFHRHATLDANRVNVAVSNGSVTLTGEVRDWHEHDEAAQAAWSAPGVVRVQNLLSVRP